MKAYLMYPDRDFDLQAALPRHEAALRQDLELDTLLAAMAAGDEFLFEVAQKAVLTSLDEAEAIRYRQRVLTDCLDRAPVIRGMYALAEEALQREQGVWGVIYARSPDGVRYRSVQVLRRLWDLLRRLRRFADTHGGGFKSEGFTRLFRMLARELGDDYLGIVADHLRRLAFRDGVLLSVELDQGNHGTRHVLHVRNPGQSWWERVKDWLREHSFSERSGYVYQITDRDDIGFRTLGELRNRGISLVASALAQSTDQIVDFFAMLRLELGFYVGCLNLRDRLASQGEPLCFPELCASGESVLSARGLYDPCLSLTIKQRTVGNDISAADKKLVMITGASRGGKSTLLRSMGLAQLMMQCGMFVPAQSFRANVCDGLFTHFKREEDADMKSGKLDEELSRMSSIVDDVSPHSIVLCNESFASTNEREGSEIAKGIVRALLERGIKVFYVTHLFELARGFYRAEMDTALFLRAERLADGRRTYRIVEGEPLPTSHAADLYRRIFRTDADRRRFPPLARGRDFP